MENDEELQLALVMSSSLNDVKQKNIGDEKQLTKLLAPIDPKPTKKKKTKEKTSTLLELRKSVDRVSIISENVAMVLMEDEPKPGITKSKEKKYCSKRLKKLKKVSFFMAVNIFNSLRYTSSPPCRVIFL